MDTALLAELGRDPSKAAERTRSELLLVAASILVVTVSLAAFVGSVAIWWSGLVPPVKFLGSIGLFLVGMLTRPQFGRLPGKDVHRLAPGEAPVLRSIVRDIATSAGAPEPDVILLDPQEVNLSVSRVGLRGRSVLTIGIPFWLLITPEMRVAVLAHEFGHLTNRDPLRGTLTAPARLLFSRAVDWTGGPGMRRRLAVVLSTVEQVDFVTIVAQAAMAAIAAALTRIQLGLESVVAPDHRRAELAADLVARRVAGTTATRGLMRRVIMFPELDVAVAYEAQRTPPSGWGALAEVHERRLADSFPTMAQATRRTCDLWSSHPSTVIRLRLIEALPHEDPTHGVQPGAFDRVDLELQNLYALTHRLWLGTREYGG